MIPPSFRPVLAIPNGRRLVLASIVGRLPITFTSLGTVLLVREHAGSFATAGIVASAEAVGAAVTTPLQGRLIDRRGQSGILIPLALGNAAGLLLLAGAAVAGAPTAVLVACGLVAGACLPPLGACIRTIWSARLPGDVVDTAYSLEAILTEVMFVTGPLLATALFVLASPAAALVAAAALAVGGTLAFATTRVARDWRSDRAAHSGGWALSSPGMRTAVAAGIWTGVTFGAVEVALAAFARAHGRASVAGLFLAAMALGSMAGGLWYGTRRWRGPAARRYLLFLALLSAGLALLLLADSIAVMAALALLAGIPIAPAAACLYRIVDDVAPAGMMAESFTWLSTSVVVGAAAGTAIAGPVVQDAGDRAALAIPAAAAAIGALLVAARRASLAPAGAMVGPT